ncbi:MAG: hypothetical protein ACKO96_07350, partial [Flammeovirgaceae bacterium]
EREYTQKVPEYISLAFPAVEQRVKKMNYKGNFVICIANESSKELQDVFEDNLFRSATSRACISLLLPKNGESFRELRVGDHSTFWDAGYPGIFIGDGADTRNPYYHSEYDSLGDLNYAFMKDVTAATLHTVAEKIQLMKCAEAYQEIDVN